MMKIISNAEPIAICINVSVDNDIPNRIFKKNMGKM